MAQDIEMWRVQKNQNDNNAETVKIRNWKNVNCRIGKEDYKPIILNMEDYLIECEKKYLELKASFETKGKGISSWFAASPEKVREAQLTFEVIKLKLNVLYSVMTSEYNISDADIFKSTTHYMFRECAKVFAKNTSYPEEKALTSIDLQQRVFNGQIRKIFDKFYEAAGGKGYDYLPNQFKNYLDDEAARRAAEEKRYANGLSQAVDY